MSMEFYFSYKGHSVRVRIDDLSTQQYYGSHYVTISYSGKTHWTQHELGVEFQNKFLTVFKQIQPDDYAFHLEEGRKGTTWLQDRSSKNNAFALLLALFTFAMDDKEFSLREREFVGEVQDINTFWSLIEGCINKCDQAPILTRNCNDLYRIDKVIELKRKIIHDEITKLKTYLQKYLTTCHGDLIRSFYDEIDKIVKGKITFTPNFIREIAFSINKLYRRALEADKNEKSDFVKSIADLFEVFVFPLSRRISENFVFRSQARRIFGANGANSDVPAFKCLAVAAFQNEYKETDEQQFWFKLACQLVSPSQIPAFICKFSKSELTSAIRSSHDIAFYVLQDAALCKQYTNNEIRSHCEHTWTQEEALIILNILRPRVPQGDYIHAFPGIKDHPIVLYKMMADPSLRPLLDSVNYKRDHYFIRDEIPSAYVHLLSELDKPEDANQELKDFLAYLLVSHETLLEAEIKDSELKSKHNEIFSKIKKKADLGFTEYQLIIANYYLQGNLFTAKDLELACKYYLLAGLQGSDEALQQLLELDAREGNSTSKYSLGKIYLDRSNTEKAYEYFSQVKPDSQYYNEAMFECGNIQYCVHKNKSEALNHFSKIDEKLPGKNYLSPILVESCRERSGANPSLTDIYAIQAKRNDKEETFIVSGVQFPKNKSMAHQLFGCTKDKKITTEALQAAWRKYKSIKNDTLKSAISTEVLAFYNKANSPIFNDTGRYQILREYVLHDKNSDSIFCMVLKEHFGENFFIADDCFSKEIPKENENTRMLGKNNDTSSKNCVAKEKRRTELDVVIDEPNNKEALDPAKLTEKNSVPKYKNLILKLQDQIVGPNNDNQWETGLLGGVTKRIYSRDSEGRRIMLGEVHITNTMDKILDRINEATKHIKVNHILEEADKEKIYKDTLLDIKGLFENSYVPGNSSIYTFFFSRDDKSNKFYETWLAELSIEFPKQNPLALTL